MFATASPGLQPEQFNQEKQRAGVAHGETDPDLSTCRGQSCSPVRLPLSYIVCHCLYTLYTRTVLFLYHFHDFLLIYLFKNKSFPISLSLALALAKLSTCIHSERCRHLILPHVFGDLVGTLEMFLAFSRYFQLYFDRQNY